MNKELQKKLLVWFHQNQRPLPWRQTRDPYKIWISEVMLQQTTSQAVIPYFTKFIRRFPRVQALAQASLEEVYEAWAGLGYYSRARNLHKSAQIIAKLKCFPKTESELIDLPGFGPYTSRSVASLAFDRPVGVLDGNVIRLLSRYYGQGFAWWKTAERSQLQGLADSWVQGVSSSQMNQTMMELGATVCLPQNPKCILCPLLTHCQAHKLKRIHQLPLKRSKRKNEIWIWQAQVECYKNSVRLVMNDYAPFLRGQWFLPGKVHKVSKKPKTFDFRHTITHHEIYVQTTSIPVKMSRQPRKNKNEIWSDWRKSQKHAPASLVQKTLSFVNGSGHRKS